MAGKRLVLADPLSDEGLEILNASTGLIVDDFSSRSRSELLAGLPGSSGLIVRSATMADAELLEHADMLEVIGRAGVGVDNIDLEAATRRGIAILNAPAGNTISTAEHAFALLLSAARGIPGAAASMREGRWDRKSIRGEQVAGKTIGVIGAGRIGTEVIRRARAFGMRVVVTDPYLTASRADDLGVETRSMEALLAEADFVTLHLPLGDATRGLIGAGEIARMRPTAVLINAARGGLVDEAALAAALRDRSLGGAALDVYEEEPLPPDHPLRDCPNLIMTPHLGASTPDAQREVAIEIARAVRDALLEGDLRSAVNVPAVPVADRDRAAEALDLARCLGTILGELTGGATESIAVRYTGAPGAMLHLVASAAVEGYLSRRLAGPLNVINALVLGEERGIEVSRSRVGPEGRGKDWIELTAVAESETRQVAGKLTARGEPRLLRVDGFRVELTPVGTLLFVANVDVPGVIGGLGTILADAGVNIAEFHQSRDRDAGQALAVVRLDVDLTGDQLARLRGIPGVRDVCQTRIGKRLDAGQ
ncbi:MAG: phosphoglycerate dehydrogenase [Gemmatimonadota bacterium]